MEFRNGVILILPASELEIVGIVLALLLYARIARNALRGRLAAEGVWAGLF